MIIKDIQIGYISLPLRHPFKTALRTVTAVNNVVVRIISDNDIIGYGEAPPTAVITGETLGSITCAIKDVIRPALLGADIENIEDVMKRLDACIIKNTSAKAAIDMAILDLWGKRWNAPLYKLIGGAKKTIETDITISLNGCDEMVADSIKAVERGYNILKIKVGKGGLADVDNIFAIHSAVTKEVKQHKVKLRIDANQGWSVRDSIRNIKAMEDKGLDIEFIEQPVLAHDIEGLRAVTQAVDTPILADEAVFSAKDAVEIIKSHSADLINIKLMKTGGIWPALKICDVAAIYGVECMVGCMLESRLSVAAAAHLAAARDIVTMVDLDGPSLCAIDPYTGGPEFNETFITMTNDAGIGVDNIPCTEWL